MKAGVFMPKKSYKRLRELIRKRLSDTQTRLLLIIMIPVVFIILTVGFSSYYTSKEILQQEINEPQYQMLQINKNYIDEYIEETDQIAVKLALDENIFQFLSNSGMESYQNIKQIYRNLTLITQNSSVIKSIYIYNKKNDSFVSIPQGFSSSSSTFNDAEWVSMVEELRDQPMVVKYRKLPDGARPHGSNITLFRKINIAGEFAGMVAINFNEAELFAKLQASNDPASNSMQYILDPNNTILFKTHSDNFDNETIHLVNEAVSVGNLTNIELNDNILLANKVESTLTDWKYVSAVSQKSVLAKSETIRNVVFIVSLVALIIGAIAIFFIHSIELKPINRLKKLFSVDKDEHVRRDLIHLERIVADLVTDHAQLEKVIVKMKGEAKAKFIYDIYNGKIMSSGEVKEKQQTYFSDWSKDDIQLLIVSIDNYPAWKDTFNNHYHVVVKAGMINILTEILGAHYTVEAVDIGEEKIIIVLQHREGKICLENHLRICINSIESILGFTVSIGMTQKSFSFSVMKQSLDKTEQVLQNRLFEGYGSIFNTEDQTELDEKQTVGRMDELVEAVSMENPMQSLEYVTHFFALVIRRTVSAELCFYFIEQLRKKLFLQNKKTLRTDYLSLEELSTMHVQDLEKVFKEKLSERLENIKKINDSKRYIKCRKMIQYMTSHLNEPIGIPEIVESVGISVSLASQWFKEEMNDTIYGYFTKLKMERAQELLISTDMKIADIALEIGYQHENSFIRKFREYKKMTPGKYRKMNTKLEDGQEIKEEN